MKKRIYSAAAWLLLKQLELVSKLYNWAASGAGWNNEPDEELSDEG